MPKIFYVQLTVGDREFLGEGKTRQAARHNAAMKALQALQNEPIPKKLPQVSDFSPLSTNTGDFPYFSTKVVINKELPLFSFAQKEVYLIPNSWCWKLKTLV